MRVQPGRLGRAEVRAQARMATGAAEAQVGPAVARQVGHPQSQPRTSRQAGEEVHGAPHVPCAARLIVITEI